MKPRINGAGQKHPRTPFAGRQRSQGTLLGAVALLLFWCTAALYPDSAVAQPRTSLNDFGAVGLMQTPTARGLGAGSVGVAFAGVDPIETYALYMQPFDWMQGGFRWINFRVPEQATGRARGRGTFTDQGFDLQLRLWKESEWLPQIALGLLDLAGNGKASSEYIVASRRWYDADFHFGIGWGRLGARGELGTPFSFVGDRYSSRERRTRGGQSDLRFEEWFTGEAAVFGGVVWTPYGGNWSLMLEMEGNDYENERFGRDVGSRSRFNYGITYRAFDAVDVAASWQRGDQFGINVSTHVNFEKITGPEKVHQPVPLGVHSPETVDRFPHPRALNTASFTRLQRELQRQWIELLAADETRNADGSRTLVVWIMQGMSSELPMTTHRLARSLMRQTGAHYDEYEIVEVVRGVESVRYRVPREMVHLMISEYASPEELAAYVQVLRPRAAGYRRAALRARGVYPFMRFGMYPMLRSNVGSPQKFAVSQLLLRGAATAHLTPRFVLAGAINYNVVDNFGTRLDQPSSSNLPQVRSNIRRYLTTGEDYYISQLAGYYTFPITGELHGRAAAGIFEEMFGGVGAEVLYQRTGARWALGADLNRVRQRDFDQRFTFQDYETTTGHLTLYYEVPWKDVRIVTSAGRYLARDIGVTLDVSRSFRNGARMGVWASMTNVSSETFGEGSFDKGFYFSIPFSLFNTTGGKSEAQFSLRQLSRDGGRKVSVGRPLYPMRDKSHTRSLLQNAEGWMQ